MHKDDPVLMIRESRDYTRFKFADGNRPINENNVNALVESIRKFGYIKAHAIIVDKNYQVIEGQHRFEACKMLNMPIYYVMDESIGIDAALALNVSRRNWATDNYLEYYCHQGKTDYNRFRLLKDEYNMFKVDGLTALFAGNFYPGGANGKGFKNGEFTIRDEDKTRELLDFMLELKKLGFKPYNQRGFVAAMGKAHAHPSFDLHHFLNRFKRKSGLLQGLTTTKEYLEAINNVYNYNVKSERNKVDLTKKPRKAKK